MNSTVTVVAGITQSSGVAPLDVLSRYPSQLQMLLRFSPLSIVLDRYITPLWLPFALCGCPIVAAVYAFSEWLTYPRPTTHHSLMRQGFSSLSVHLTCIALSLSFRAFFLILVDLDVAWDTGILASSALACPLVHVFCTTFKHASVVYTLFLAVEALAFSNENSFVFGSWPLKWFRAGRNVHKAIRIAVVILLVSLCIGLIETAYWRVKYYTPTFGNKMVDQLPTLSTRMSRCEVVGGFQRFLAGEYLQATNHYTNEAQVRIDGLAASYADYRWVKAIVVDCFTALLCLFLALMIVRNRLLRPPTLDTIAIAWGKVEVKHIVTWCLLYGLSRLPESLLTMLEPLSRPGDTRLTDGEVEVDRTWQRYLTMLTAQVVTFELSDGTSALLLPICLSLNREFRNRFFEVFCCALPICISNKACFKRIIFCKRNMPVARGARTHSLYKPPQIKLNRADRSPSSSVRYVDTDALRHMHEYVVGQFDNEHVQPIYDQDWLPTEETEGKLEQSAKPTVHDCVQCLRKGGIPPSSNPTVTAMASTCEFNGNQTVTVLPGFPHTCQADWYEPRSFV